VKESEAERLMRYRPDCPVQSANTPDRNGRIYESGILEKAFEKWHNEHGSKYFAGKQTEELKQLSGVPDKDGIKYSPDGVVSAYFKWAKEINAREQSIQNLIDKWQHDVVQHQSGSSWHRVAPSLTPRDMVGVEAMGPTSDQIFFIKCIWENNMSLYEVILMTKVYRQSKTDTTKMEVRDYKNIEKFTVFAQGTHQALLKANVGVYIEKHKIEDDDVAYAVSSSPINNFLETKNI